MSSGRGRAVDGGGVDGVGGGVGLDGYAGHGREVLGQKGRHVAREAAQHHLAAPAPALALALERPRQGQAAGEVAHGLGPRLVQHKGPPKVEHDLGQGAGLSATAAGALAPAGRLAVEQLPEVVRRAEEDVARGAATRVGICQEKLRAERTVPASTATARSLATTVAETRATTAASTRGIFPARRREDQEKVAWQTTSMRPAREATGHAAQERGQARHPQGQGRRHGQPREPRSAPAPDVDEGLAHGGAAAHAAGEGRGHVSQVLAPALGRGGALEAPRKRARVCACARVCVCRGWARETGDGGKRHDAPCGLMAPPWHLGPRGAASRS